MNFRSFRRQQQLLGIGSLLQISLAWTQAPMLFAREVVPVLADDVERWFVPGQVGREEGIKKHEDRASLSSQGRSFLTRVLWGINNADRGEWAQFNQLTQSLSFSHNLAVVFPVEVYDKHPEFFPLERGVRLRPKNDSPWWNPDISTLAAAMFAANKAREHFSEYSSSLTYSLGVTDGLIFGESPELLALTTPLRWFRERPDYSNLVFTFSNRSAADLATTHPGKYIGTLAYYWAENAPDFPVHPQVIPFLTADRSQGYDQSFLEEDNALQARWVDRMQSGRSTQRAGLHLLGAGRQNSSADPPMRIGIYDYIYGSGFLIPRIHTRLIAENLRKARRLGFSDYFAEMTPNWGLDGPQPWLVAQLLQDPEQAERRLLAEYYRRYFRESAFYMQRFYERCEEQWMGQPGRSYWLKHFRNESQAAIFPSAVCRELKGILDAALARAKSEIVRLRVQQVCDAFGVTQRLVAMKESRDTLNRLALTETANVSAIVTALTRFQIMRESFVAYTERLLREQPELVGPFRKVDYLLHDPTANALARLVAIEDGIREIMDRVGRKGENEAVLNALVALKDGGDELVANSGMQGPLQSARVIAGLAYRVALPIPWQSKVEPSEHQMAGIKAGQPGVLFIGGSKDVEVFQWAPLGGRSYARAQVHMRGRVSESTVVMLTLSWLDRNHRHLKMAAIRLPEGEWPSWVNLVQASEAPEGSEWVGLSLTVRHQAKDDWVEARGFSLISR